MIFAASHAAEWMQAASIMRDLSVDMILEKGCRLMIPCNTSHSEGKHKTPPTLLSRGSCYMIQLA